MHKISAGTRYKAVISCVVTSIAMGETKRNWKIGCKMALFIE